MNVLLSSNIRNVSIVFDDKLSTFKTTQITKFTIVLKHYTLQCCLIAQKLQVFNFSTRTLIHQFKIYIQSNLC